MSYNLSREKQVTIIRALVEGVDRRGDSCQGRQGVTGSDRQIRTLPGVDDE